jgi:hypothetical protein
MHLLLLLLLCNLTFWQTPTGCQSYIWHLGNYHAIVTQVDHAATACTNWRLEVFDAGNNQG